MSLRRAGHPFQFVTQVNLIEVTGQKAKDVKELLQILKEVPTSVVYFHTHHFLKQHQFLSPEPRNDFAYWVTNVLQEDVLGEQLAAVDTIQFSSTKQLQEKFIKVIEHYLASNRRTVIAPEGENFYFMKSQSFVLPTRHLAYDLSEFLAAIQKVSIHSLYHHIFSARLRLGRVTNDFSNWLENELEEKELGKALSRLDPYTQTLEGLRKTIIHLLETRITELNKVGTNVH